MIEFGHQWRLVSKEVYDKFQRHRALEVEQNSANLRQLLEEAFDAGAAYAMYAEGYDGVSPDFNEWIEKRFS